MGSSSSPARSWCIGSSIAATRTGICSTQRFGGQAGVEQPGPKAERDDDARLCSSSARASAYTGRAASTAAPSSAMFTSRASARWRTVVHATLLRPSSIRPSELIDTPERNASASCVRPRSSRRRRSTWARAGSGEGARDMRWETSHAPDRQVHSESSRALPTGSFRRRLPCACAGAHEPTPLVACPACRTQCCCCEGKLILNLQSAGR
jgi:hypothetical protein